MGDVIEFDKEAAEAESEVVATMRRILASQEKLLKALENLGQMATAKEKH